MALYARNSTSPFNAIFYCPSSIFAFKRIDLNTAYSAYIFDS
jgi:hypothetical protein